MLARLQSPWLAAPLLFIAGALVHFSMAPYTLWLLAILCPWVLGLSLYRSTPRGDFWRALSFNLGLCGAGVSWIYVSISQYGSTTPAIAAMLMALFIGGIAFIFTWPYWLCARLFRKNIYALALGFPAVFILGEWMRSWLFTGFPWLYLGYGVMETPLMGWAPVLGVFGVGLLSLLATGFLGLACSALLRDKNRTTALMWLLAAIAPGLIGRSLLPIAWTQPVGKSISIGMVQPNIPQEEKWDPLYYAQNVKVLRELTEPLWGKDWIIWPEAAIPFLYHDAEPFLEQIDLTAKRFNSVFISGIIFDDLKNEKYYNTILARGTGGSGMYFKQRLVPFGEYVPFEEHLRGLIGFFDLPVSIINVGPAQQNGLKARDLLISPAVCYEIAYPDLVARRAKGSNILLTISNDAWFAESIGPLQHFQIARMRAAETRRYVVRATNTGMTGIIDPFGKVQVIGDRYKREAITGEARGVEGLTPYMVWLNWPVLILCFLLLGWSYFATQDKKAE
jgi:apolipoprotein N-acyltransferase